MPSRRIRTADYPERRRRALAEAVVAARTAAGLPTTVDLARATGRSSRALYALENAEPTVGQLILQAVGQTLGEKLPGSGWGPDTPRDILEGKPPPTLAATGQDKPKPEDYPTEYEYMLAVYAHLVRDRDMSHEAVIAGFNMAAAMLRDRANPGSKEVG